MHNNALLFEILGATSIVILILMFLTILFIFVFYKKYNKILTDVYTFLINNNYISGMAESFFSGLGLFGFTHRAIIMSKFIGGKPVKIERGKYLNSQASRLLLSNFELEWLKRFVVLYKVAMVLVCSMFFIVLIKKIYL